MVLGPAQDGGYYLIGLSRPMPELFRGIPWGTDRVLADSLAVLQRRGCKPALLDPLEDIDRPEDLPAWHRIVGLRRCAPGPGFRHYPGAERRTPYRRHPARGRARVCVTR